MSGGKKAPAQPALHKVIMVGSGGVGKSALTLQFMYDEVSLTIFSIDFFYSYHFFYSLLKIMNQLKLIATEKK